MQDRPTVIRKGPLRDEVHALLRDRIVQGVLPQGSRLQDSQVAGELGVSRTPVREALLGLEMDGLVENDPNRGFFVAPLSREEVLQVYPIVWALECLALSSSEPLTRPRIQELRRINAELAAVPDDARRCHELDMRWHQTLAESCGNHRLKTLLDNLRHIIRRYECSVYMREAKLVRRSARDHGEILDALEKGKAELASRLLERNWRVGMEFILERLQDHK
jgi:DNA-binding GntR family transcriptional regulator